LLARNLLPFWLAAGFMAAAISRPGCPVALAAESAAGIEADIEVRDAWIRWLPASTPSGGYMTMTNTGNVARLLLGASSADFGEVSFHQTHTANGVSQMTAVNSLTVGPHSSLRFAPGGYHIMLLQPRRSLHAGDRVTISLRFADGRSVPVAFEVRGADAGLPARADDMSSMPGMK
jgi:copper(I)-binding protein